MNPIIKLMCPSLLKSSLIAGSLFFAGSFAMAQEKQNMGNTATENNTVEYVTEDDRWTKDAFNARLSEDGVYPRWQNQTGRLSQDEFSSGMFNRWDADQDGYLSYEEYNAGNIPWAEDYGDNFEAWDQDDDQQLDAGEYTAGMEETGIYEEWDVGGEGYLTEEEFGDGLFNTLDADDDAYLTDDEFGEGGYEAWFESGVGGGGTDSDLGAGGGTDTDIDGGTDIDTETGTETGPEIETGSGVDPDTNSGMDDLR